MGRWLHGSSKVCVTGTRAREPRTSCSTELGHPVLLHSPPHAEPREGFHPNRLQWSSATSRKLCSYGRFHPSAHFHVSPSWDTPKATAGSHSSVPLKGWFREAPSARTVATRELCTDKHSSLSKTIFLLIYAMFAPAVQRLSLHHLEPTARTAVWG